MDASFRLIFCGMFAGIPAIFYLIGLFGALDQMSTFRNAVATQGVVIPREIVADPEAADELKGSKSKSTVEPVSIEPVFAKPTSTDPANVTFQFNRDFIQGIIAFRYEVDGRSYTGSQNTFMLDNLDSFIPEHAAEDKKYALGSAITVYYSPDNPKESYIIRDIDSIYFIMMLFVTPFWLGAVLVFNVAKPARAIMPATLAESGWYTLRLTVTRSDKLFAAWMMLIVAMIPGASIFMYMSIAPLWHAIEMLVFSTLWAVVMVVLISTVVYQLMTFRAGKDPIVFINAPYATIGNPIAIRVEHTFSRFILEGALEVGLHCRRDTKTSNGKSSAYGSDTPHDLWLLTKDVENAAAKQPIICEGTIIIPDAAHPSRTAGENSYPRHQWSIQVRTSLKGPDYNGKFGLLVRTA